MGQPAGRYSSPALALVKPVGKERFAMLTIVLVLVRTIVAIMVQLVGQDCNLALVHVTSAGSVQLVKQRIICAQLRTAATTGSRRDGAKRDACASVITDLAELHVERGCTR
jgi:hypothetical protein